MKFNVLKFLILFFWLIFTFCTSLSDFNTNNSIDFFNGTLQGQRHAKYIDLSSKTSLPTVFTVVNFKNEGCTANSFPPRNGTCYTHHECRKRGGTVMGGCAWGFGSCCVFSKTCNELITENCTYFTNPEFDWGAGYQPVGHDMCEIKVMKIHPSVCQLRLDFDTMDLFGVTNGACAVDNFNVIGGSTIPSICGENSGQHVYVNVPDSTDNVRLQVNLDGSSFAGVTDRFDRRWSIKVTQIECNNPNLAPPGCVQYFTGRTGKITSFNFGNDVTQSTLRYPNNLNYGVCIKKVDGYCSIRYTKNMQFQFGVNPDEPEGVYRGPDCGLFGNPGDYVIIPNSEPQNDRYCGGNFPPGGVSTSSMPYVLTVVSDDVSYGEGGFMLDYKQQPC